MRFAALSAFVFFGGLACAPSARADCANTQNAFDNVYCNMQVFHQADHQLNMDYSALAKTLNPAEKNSLKHAEIVWIKDRNDQCTQSQDGWDFVAMDCALDMTNKRDAFIQKITRDCASTGCVDSDIAKENDD